MTKKIATPLPPGAAREIIADFLTWDVVMNDGEAVLEAIDIQSDERISFWDALIVAASRRGGATALLSEDFSDGRRFGDIVSPKPVR